MVACEHGEAGVALRRFGRNFSWGPGEGNGRRRWRGCARTSSRVAEGRNTCGDQERQLERSHDERFRIRDPRMKEATRANLWNEVVHFRAVLRLYALFEGRASLSAVWCIQARPSCPYVRLGGLRADVRRKNAYCGPRTPQKKPAGGI